VLEEIVGYLAARKLEPGEDEVFLQPTDTGQEGSVYEHCCRALDRSLTEGPHGLPLFGTGDWNDGMNRVGREGRGESVWMGFFLYRILDLFLPYCEQRGDSLRQKRYREYRDHLSGVLNGAGWDGRWYRRGYYDDGDPLGSGESDECRIDSLAQAWSVISQAATSERAEQAMNAVEEHLISEKDGIIRLLIPPFENTPHDPGYIKGYVRGVRENGGQYTHAALWVVRAMAELGRTERAAHLLTMLSPISHTQTREQVDAYKIEPYVIAADVYGAEPHVGRGGWSWYTGSAGWMFRVALESILGFTISAGRTLNIRPCVPSDWAGFKIRYRVPGEETSYVIEVTNSGNYSCRVGSGTLDGNPIATKDGAAHIPLFRDGATHYVNLTLE
jgi:N,N'-diacetylchitobiose phosphorylase